MALTSTEKHQRMIDREFPPGHPIHELGLERRKLVVIAGSKLEDKMAVAHWAAAKGASVVSLQEEVKKLRLGNELTDQERKTLEQCEAVVERGLQTFVEVGQALLSIRDGRLYRETHQTFDDYCRERWGMARQRAYQLIDAVEVVRNVSTVVDIVPANERQARPLTRLPDPEQQREVWREVVEEGQPISTARVVQKVREAKRQGRAPTQTPSPALEQRPDVSALPDDGTPTQRGCIDLEEREWPPCLQICLTTNLANVAKDLAGYYSLDQWIELDSLVRDEYARDDANPRCDHAGLTAGGGTPPTPSARSMPVLHHEPAAAAQG